MLFPGFYSKHHHFVPFLKSCSSGRPTKIHLKGLCGSAPAMLAAEWLLQSSSHGFFILSGKDEAAYFAGDLITLLGPERVFFFPSSYKRKFLSGEKDTGALMIRSEVLSALAALTPESSPVAVVTYPEALVEKIISQEDLRRHTLYLHEGEKISLSFVCEVLQEYRFERVDFVYEPGQYAVRGSIVDVFSFSCEHPFRIDFFGDEVESLRTFNVENQLSLESRKEISIVPDFNRLSGMTEMLLPGYFPSSCIWWGKDLAFVYDQMQQWYEKATGGEKKEMFVSASVLFDQAKDHTVVEYGQVYFKEAAYTFIFNTLPQPSFNKQFNLLAENLQEHALMGYENYILSDNPVQFERLKEIFKGINPSVSFIAHEGSLHEGFIEEDLKKTVYTDHQIFQRFQKLKVKQGFRKSEALTLSELNRLQPGDYVVHIDHGVGRFGGLEKIELNGRQQEVIKLVYQDNDVVYLSIHSLHKISKYKSSEGEPPKIYKLGSGAWQRLKENAKKKIKDIARDLILLYARRMSSPGFAFSPDTYLQQELEASFIYEDTPDQAKATVAVKRAMEMPRPMDMLVCGDVGFGKTEVAIRAAFKAVADSKQVAVLVPTTILAMQHYKTFSERLQGFPCTVDYLSRFRSPAAKKEILSRLREGKIDILIGTHSLLGKEVRFKDLGLLIIDEEQKFGVAAKEKIKSLKTSVDTLTLTATPIPRTLQFSLMGARDMTIITTPPPNRQPIHTEVHPFGEEIIKEALEYELARGGQVFFIHNRVQNLEEIEMLVKRLCPKAATAIAHGQMENSILEKIMLEFIAGNIDVLISTNIIESGLDIPNANTIIINNAHHFGLSDLHQLRGRVGRSNRKAFCYLLTPPLNTLTAEARRRLEAIENFSDLGSGFHIAMQDLDIRGAGNLLGSEQSGFIAEMGYETYQRILNEAIMELREKEFKELFAEKEKEQNLLSPPSAAFSSDCQIDTDFELLFPETYISSITERTHLYKELDNVQSREALEAFRQALTDRFGPLPPPAEELLLVVLLRQNAMRMGIEKIVIKNQKMVCYFVSDPESSFYHSSFFPSLMRTLQRHHGKISVKETKGKLMLLCNEVKSISHANQWLEELEKETLSVG